MLKIFLLQIVGNPLTVTHFQPALAAAEVTGGASQPTLEHPQEDRTRRRKINTTTLEWRCPLTGGKYDARIDLLKTQAEREKIEASLKIAFRTFLNICHEIGFPIRSDVFRLLSMNNEDLFYALFYGDTRSEIKKLLEACHDDGTYFDDRFETMVLRR